VASVFLSIKTIKSTVTLQLDLCLWGWSSCWLESWGVVSLRVGGSQLVKHYFGGPVAGFAGVCPPFCAFGCNRLVFFERPLQHRASACWRSSKELTHCCTKDLTFHCPKASSSCQLYQEISQCGSFAAGAYSWSIAYPVTNKCFFYLEDLNYDQGLLNFLGSRAEIQVDVFPPSRLPIC